MCRRDDDGAGSGWLQGRGRLEELELGLTSGFVREALNRAVGGVGPPNAGGQGGRQTDAPPGYLGPTRGY